MIVTEKDGQRIKWPGGVVCANLLSQSYLAPLALSVLFSVYVLVTYVRILHRNSLLFTMYPTSAKRAQAFVYRSARQFALHCTLSHLISWKQLAHNSWYVGWSTSKSSNPNSYNYISNTYNSSSIHLNKWYKQLCFSSWIEFEHIHFFFESQYHSVGPNKHLTKYLICSKIPR